MGMRPAARMGRSKSSTNWSQLIGAQLNTLFFIFLTLKLTHNITWSWWFVAMPVWLPWSILLLIAFIVGINRIAESA